MIYQIGDDLPFNFAYIDSKLGATGLTVTVKGAYRNGVSIAAIVGDPIPEIGDGLYRYVLNGAAYVDAAGDYTVVATTVDTDVDQRDMYAVDVVTPWVADIDAAITSRAVAGDAMALTAAERAMLYAGVWSYLDRTLTDLDLSAAQISEAVWDEILTRATYNVANSAGRLLWQLAEDVGVLDLPTYTQAYQRGLWKLKIGTYIDERIPLGRAIYEGDVLVMTAKRKYRDADSEALFQIRSDTGLQVLMGNPATDHAGAVLALLDATVGLTNIRMAQRISTYLPEEEGVFDIVLFREGNKYLLVEGTILMSRTVTSALSV